jgi:hypothetical protein
MQSQPAETWPLTRLGVVRRSCFELKACVNVIVAMCSAHEVRQVRDVEATGKCEVFKCYVEGRRLRLAVAA